MKKSEKKTLEYFIPISRKLFEHRLWCEEREFSRFEAWIYLLKEARFEDMKLYDGNKVITIQRGQVYASIRFLSKAFGWSTKKLLNFIDLLITDNMITKETVKETGQTLITICNYDRYNTLDLKRETPKETIWKQQGNSKETKYNKDINKENKDKDIIPPIIPQVGVEEKNWRDDFQIYILDLDSQYNAIISDGDFIAERQKYFPHVNIQLSIEKAYKDFWSTERGWQNKKKSKTVNIDWKATFRNSLNERYNHVYLNKNEIATTTDHGTGVWVENGKKYYGSKSAPNEIPMNAPRRTEANSVYYPHQNKWMVE